MRLARREKVFGPGRAAPLDRNAKARIQAYARAWDRRHRQPGHREGARSAGLPWTSWAPCCGPSTTPARAAAFRPMNGSPRRLNAPAAPWPRPSRRWSSPGC
jgi:hypothetical protein